MHEPVQKEHDDSRISVALGDGEQVKVIVLYINENDSVVDHHLLPHPINRTDRELIASCERQGTGRRSSSSVSEMY